MYITPRELSSPTSAYNPCSDRRAIDGAELACSTLWRETLPDEITLRVELQASAV
jgi:hypothetical protein